MIEFMFSGFWTFFGMMMLISIVMLFVLRLVATIILAYTGDDLSQETRNLISKLAELDGSTKGD